MFNLGLQEIILVFVFLSIFVLPVALFFYWLGKRSGYKEGRMDVYRNHERRSSTTHQ